MSENFDVINAPQFFDFSKNIPDDGDDFFDNYNELEMKTDPTEDPLDLADAESEIINIDDEELLLKDHEDQRFFRRSMSMGDLAYLQTALEKATLCENEGKKEKDSDVKIKKISSQQSISKESLNRLAQPKKKFGSDQHLNRASSLTMAEAVKRFQQGTPERFRTKPKIDASHRVKLGNTIPHSPHLISNKRIRPVNAISHEEQEQLDFEEARKFKIKAHPVNKKVLQGPMKPTIPVDKKPTTVPQPFNLTEVHHKVVDPPKNEVQEFQARPVPDFSKPTISKTTYQRQVTKPQTPNILKRYQRLIQQKTPLEGPKEPPVQKQPMKSMTTVLPFSFEARNEQLRKRKEASIQKFLEEEKKAREFHARPVPKAVQQIAKNRNESFGSGNPVRNNSLKSKTKSEENLSTEFRARPPTVLYKKPFEPKRGERPLTEINDFQLKTDLRAREREYFEQHLKEKEKRLAVAKELEEQMRIQKEQEEIIRFRKMAEYKAQPIKKYKEVVIQPSGKITEPVSPKFCVRKKEQKNRESLEADKENSHEIIN